MPIVSDHTALLSGSYWGGIEVVNKPTIVTYSFPTAAAGYLSGIDGFTSATVASFQAFSAAEQTQARAALGEWAAASGIIFIEVAPGQGDINFQLVDLDQTELTDTGGSYVGAGGIAFYPFGGWDFFTYPYFSSDIDASGDVFMNTQFETGDEVEYGTLLHEIGHALGLKHPTEIVYSAEQNDPDLQLHDEVLASNDSTLTIMAEGPGGTAVLKQLDKDAVAHIYGAAGAGGVYTTSASGSNSAVASWSWNSLTATLTQTGFVSADEVRGSSVKDVISGLGGDDELYGLAGNDTLNGGADADLLHGGAGIDTMSGGAGDDTYFVDAAGDKTIEAADEGIDFVITTVSRTLGANLENMQIFGAGLFGRGNALDNTIYGDGAFANRIYGMAGFDYLTGGAESDILDGGSDIDGMAGFGGADRYYVDSEFDYIFEDLDAAVDTVFSRAATYALATNVENLTLLSADPIDGTGNDLDNFITGNGAANVLRGGVGADTLYGKGGIDDLDGGEGDDTYFRPDFTDILFDSGATTGDRVVSAASFTLTVGNGIENLQVLAGTQAATLNGNELANLITGNDGANTLRGNAGNDTLNGGLGDDRLEGGLGQDIMTGGGDGDMFVIRAGESDASAGAFDRINDFVSGLDRINLDIIDSNGFPIAEYEETSVASNAFATLLAAANAAMADGEQQVVFVAGSNDGWLFWSTDGVNTTVESAVRLSGLNATSLFAHGDLM